MNFATQINGTVRFAEGRAPVDHALVSLESFSGGLIGQVSTDRTGKFSFTRLGPIQYTVTVHLPGFYDVREDVNLVTNPTAYLDIQLRPDRSSPMNAGSLYNIQPLGTVSANVPPEAQTEFQLGQSLVDQGKREKLGEAVKHFEKAVSLYPEYVEAEFMLGLTYMDLQQWENAEKAMLAAIKINANASTAQFALGEIYRRQKKYTDAEKAILGGLKVSPDSGEGHLALAKLYYEMAPSATSPEDFRGKLESSWKETEQALKLKPTLADAHIVAGNLLLKARRPEPALEHFKKYLELSPKGEFATEASTMVAKIKQAMAANKKN
jgi:tetratricopeptide (TPR) repeat protein